jgi:hypothetical protein
MDDRVAAYSRRAALGGVGAFSAALLGSVVGPAVARADQLPPPDYGVDVRRLGAKGDGQTDDTVAVQQALDLAGTGGSHLVVVPPGVYRITQPLTAIAPIHIVGLGGEASSVLNFEGSLPSGLTITQASTEEPYPGPPIELSGLTFQYGGPGAALFISEDGVRSPFQNTRVSGCRFYVRGSATGLSSLNQRSLVVTQCQFLGSGHSTGIAINDSDNTTIVQNVFYHMQYGIHGIRGAVRVYNAGCVVIGNSMSGFEKALFFENWESVQIVGNMLDGASLQCVHLVDCYRGSLSGNYLGPTGTESALLIETSSPRRRSRAAHVPGQLHQSLRRQQRAGGGRRDRCEPADTGGPGHHRREHHQRLPGAGRCPPEERVERPDHRQHVEPGQQFC